MKDFDSTPFRGKMAWSKRAALIRKYFPSTAKLDFAEVFKQDPYVLGRILKSVFESEMAEPGRPGKRPALGHAQAAEKLRQFSNNDYTILPFNEAFRALKGNRSVRHFANRVGLPKSTVDRMLKNESSPDLETIEKVAIALGKKPSYFVEYRIGYIMAVISHYLEWAPESSVIQYDKIRGRYESVRS